MNTKENKISTWVGNRIALLDKVLAGLIGVTILLYYLKIELWSSVFIGTMFSGALTYHFWAYFNNKDTGRTFLERAAFIWQRSFASLAIVGILFAILEWKGGWYLLVIGGFSTLLTTISSIYFYYVRPGNQTNNAEAILRFGLISVISVWFILKN